MSRLPIRLRLTLVFAAAMGVILAGAGSFVYLRVADDLQQALDQELRARAQDLSALVLHRGSLQATSGTLIERGESFAELLDSSGGVLDSTSPIGGMRLVTLDTLAGARKGPVFANRSSLPGLDEPARMLAIPLERDGRRLVLVVGGTRENRAETLSSLRAAFLIGGPLALVLASLGGYLLAGAALRPIEAMRRRAREISTSSLDERLPVPPAADEVARLGETLNEMLARIEDGLERERRFVADASHELRTPLALLRTELELALRRGRTAAELEQAIHSAAGEADRLARIADDLLLLARSEQDRLPLRLEPTDVADVLETVAGRFASRAEVARLSVDAGDATVMAADRLRLEQALGNLVDNALRHGAGAVSLSAATRNGALELHVVDEGPGFPPDFIGRAFERFSRADDARAGGGSGLGLAIVETVARAHDGRAQVANRPEGGADVWIAFPLSPSVDHPRDEMEVRPDTSLCQTNVSTLSADRSRRTQEGTSMSVIGIRELSRETSRVIRELERTGEPIIVTREGRPIGALVPVDQTQLEDMVLASAPELTRTSQSAYDETETRSLEEVALERGVTPPARSEDATGTAEIEEWAQAAAAREFAPLSGVLTSAILRHITVGAANEVGKITQQAVRAVEQDSDANSSQPDELRRVTELNMSLYARFLRHRLPTVLNMTSEKAESTIDEATREVAKEVRLIATSMAGPELGSVTNYEAALRGVDLACKRMEPTTMLFRRS